MDFQQGDIVRIWVDDELPEPDHNLPGEGWDAIIVSVRAEDDSYSGVGQELEVAWLERFTAPVQTKAKPVRETWDDQTSLVTPEYDAHVKLLKRAEYTSFFTLDTVG